MPEIEDLLALSLDPLKGVSPGPDPRRDSVTDRVAPKKPAPIMVSVSGASRLRQNFTFRPRFTIRGLPPEVIVPKAVLLGVVLGTSNQR